MNKIIFLTTIIVLLLVIYSVLNDESIVERELIKPSMISSEYGDYELIALYKCELNNSLFYKKSENTNKIADAGKTTYYDSLGREICVSPWISVNNPCEDEINCNWLEVYTNWPS